MNLAKKTTIREKETLIFSDSRRETHDHGYAAAIRQAPAVHVRYHNRVPNIARGDLPVPPAIRNIDSNIIAFFSSRKSSLPEDHRRASAVKERGRSVIWLEQLEGQKARQSFGAAKLGQTFHLQTDLAHRVAFLIAPPLHTSPMCVLHRRRQNILKKIVKIKN